jgi:hypothetical protein
MPMQRPHDANPSEHRWPVMFCDEKQSLHHGQPFFFGIVFRLGQFGDLLRGVAERYQLASVGRMIGSENC